MRAALQFTITGSAVGTLTAYAKGRTVAQIETAIAAELRKVVFDAFDYLPESDDDTQLNVDVSATCSLSLDEVTDDQQ